jgi:hypothetical protein
LNAASKKRAIGPRPVRTARGAGRRLRVAPRAAGRLVDFFFFFDEVLLWFRVLRARAVEEPPEGVLRLREPGGEDVRAATPPTLGNRHTSHTHHRSACRGREWAGQLEETSAGLGFLIFEGLDDPTPRA